jgi:hypothetical protein
MGSNLGIDAAFGHWLAGFVAGEGHFYIAPQNDGGYRCGFTIKLRDDDSAILEEIRKRVGHGRMFAASRPPSQPQVEWKVNSRDGCAALVALFDEYPLRAKKARDYAIWREAVSVWLEMPHANGHTGRNDYSQMEALKAALQNGRQYVARELISTEVTTTSQLRLVS